MILADRWREEALGSIKELSGRCRENILMLEEELWSNDPDLSERCGWLNDRYEVFAIRIPQCAPRRLVLSIDFDCGSPPPAMLHGTVPAGRACDAARQLVVKHRAINDPLRWDMP